jgi:hypothetical protein
MPTELRKPPGLSQYIPPTPAAEPLREAAERLRRPPAGLFQANCCSSRAWCVLRCYVLCPAFGAEGGSSAPAGGRLTMGGP